MCWLGQHNVDLVLKNIDANTKMTDLGARQRALEEELARTAGERDVQRAAVEQKAQEAEARTADLQCVRTVIEQKEAELHAREGDRRHALRDPRGKGQSPRGKGGGHPERGGRSQGEGGLLVLAR